MRRANQPSGEETLSTHRSIPFSIPFLNMPMLRIGEETADTELILVDNWVEELMERAGN